MIYSKTGMEIHIERKHTPFLCIVAQMFFFSLPLCVTCEFHLDVTFVCYCHLIKFAWHLHSQFHCYNGISRKNDAKKNQKNTYICGRHIGIFPHSYIQQFMKFNIGFFLGGTHTHTHFRTDAGAEQQLFCLFVCLPIHPNSFIKSNERAIQQWCEENGNFLLA